MPTPTSAVKVNPNTGALIDPPVATFAAINGLLTTGSADAKNSVRAATTTNGTLATSFENGDTIDGIVLATSDRILIKDQSAPAANGIYTVNASGAPTRATDFDAWDEIIGAFVSVESGTVNAGTQWLCNVVAGGTLNTNDITFVVPKNFVDLTTNQNIGGTKTFALPPVFTDASGTRTALGLAIGTNVQAYDADLTTWAGITPGSGVGTNLARPIFATVATAAGTTTLTVTSAATQEFTGSTTQTVTNPVVTTLVAGWATNFINKSTGNVTLNSSGGNAIVVLAGGQSVTLVCKSISADTTAAAWDVVGLSPRLWVARNAATDTTLPSATWTLLTFATANGGNMASSMTSTIFTAPKAGSIKISFAGLIYGQTGTYTNIAEVGVRVQKNAEAVATSALMLTDFIGEDNGGSFNGWYNPCIILSCAAGDTFKIYGFFSNDGSDGEMDDYSAIVEYQD